MKKTAILLSLVLMCLLCMVALGDSNRNVPLKSPIKGPEGAIAYKITLPEGFNPNTDRCPMVILMHGIFANKGINPIPALARALAKAGIASIRFDFDGHGKSQGRMQDMTIEKGVPPHHPTAGHLRHCQRLQRSRAPFARQPRRHRPSVV